MYNKKVLLAAILLILVKSALGIEVIEVESNNTSNLATELQLGGIENVGQLSDGNDVDFFLVKPIETKDEAGAIQYNDVSLSFACNNRALASKNKLFGWYLTIHDDIGVLQSSYQVEPDECATGTSSSKGPYNFKFPKPALNKHEAKYYLSVVGDCRKPVFNISNDPLISINTSDKPATQSDIDKTKKVLADVQIILNNTEVKLSAVSDDLSLTTIIDAIDLAQSNITSRGASNLKDIKLPAIQSVTDINIDDYMSQATDITTPPTLSSTSKAQVNAVKSTLTTVKSLLNTTSVTLSSSTTITTARNELLIAAQKITSTSIEQVDVEDLIIKINNFNSEVNRLNSPIENLNTTVANLNTSVSTTQDICSASNSANYTIKDNPDTVVAPYKTIKEQSIVLGKENSGQNGSVADVDFFELSGSIENVIPLKFSCAKNSAKGKEQGWVISAWKPNEKAALDKPEFVYQVSPTDCNAPEVYSIQLPPSEKNYYIGVQSACALPPRDTATTLQSSYWYSSNTSLDFLCDANTANFTLTRDFKTAVPLIIDESKTGEMNSRSDYDLFVVENNATENYSMSFSCETASDETQWKISVYDDTDKLVSSYPKLIKGSACKTAAFKLDKLPKNATHYYISIEPPSTSATPDTSKYTIKKEKITVPTTEVTTTSGTTVILGETKLFSTIEKGQITKTKEGFSVLNYYVDGSSKKETTLVFACNNPKVLFSNNWNVSVYKSDKTLKDSYVINSSDCIPDPVTGESAYTITIPKESARFYIQVKSMCDAEDSSCKLDDSEFTMTRKPDISTSAPVPTSSVGSSTVVKTSDTFDSSWLTTKKNLGASLKTAQIQSLTDVQVYQIDTGTEDANLTFSCNNSIRYQNDWKLLIYDSAKTLKSTTLINGSSCATGTGYAISPLTKDSPTYYLVVKSACDVDDKTCEIDKSQYQLKRVTATQAATNAATKPCFGTNCAAVTTPVKPFFK